MEPFDERRLNEIKARLDELEKWREQVNKHLELQTELADELTDAFKDMEKHQSGVNKRSVKALKSIVNLIKTTYLINTQGKD